MTERKQYQHVPVTVWSLYGEGKHCITRVPFWHGHPASVSRLKDEDSDTKPPGYFDVVMYYRSPKVQSDAFSYDYLTTHTTHYIYGYMTSDIWERTTQIGREETSCRHIGYSFRLPARVLLYASPHRQENTYYGLCYTSCGALAGTRNSSMGPPHERSIRRPIAPWGNTLTTELHLAPSPTMYSRTRSPTT